MAQGGKRKGAGRPKGSPERIKLLHYFKPEEVLDLVETLKKQAKKNPKVAMFLFEQLAGKAIQQIQGTDDGPPVQFIIAKEIADKHKL